jgi:hypothetical protein
MNNISKMPTVVSRRDKRSLIPIASLMSKEERTNKGIRRQLEKYTDMEHHIRAEITKKRIRIFVQQKHFTKKSMYTEDTYGNIPKRELTTKSVVRKSRLDSIPADRLTVNSAIVPRLRTISNTTASHLSRVFDLIQPDPDFGDIRQVKKTLPKIAVSDFEEATERQRFLKYDNIWQRAEEAFVAAKRGGAEK